MLTSIRGNRPPLTQELWYAGTDEIKGGEALCFDHDLTHASAAEQAIRRASFVETPSLDNREYFAGVVDEGFKARTGPCYLPVIPPDQFICKNVQVWTNQNVTQGDLLGIVPGTRTWGKYTGGPLVCRAMETIDRSATAGMVRVEFGMIPVSQTEIERQVFRFFDAFDGQKTVGTTADRSTYLLSGTSAAAAFDDDASGGVLELTTDTTNQANLTLNGEPVKLAGEKNCLFLVRVGAGGSVAADTDAFVGLSVTDTSYWATKPTDYIGFEIVDGAITFTYVKNGTSGVVTVSTGITLTADQFAWLAFHYDGEGNLRVFHKGPAASTFTQLAHTFTATELPDDEQLTFIADILGSASRTLRLDTLEINNTR